MLTKAEIEQYRELGYLVVPGVFDAELLAEIRRAVDAIIADAGKVTTHTDVYDLEESHTPEKPRVRRIKTPHKHFPFFAELTRNPRITGVLAQLIGSDLRLHGAKLNMKSAGYGAAVEWHQDWAFYPHTNDDVLATGLYLDDCDMANGPLLVVPGTHKGPVYDHHADGYFVGAMAPEIEGLDYAKAVPLTGKAGSMTIHHARLVHGSALNTSSKPRRLLLHEYTAADAWPLMGVANFDEFNGRMVLGKPTIEPRLTGVPVRMPLPPAPFQGSIYENQRAAAKRFFASAAE
ncbi:MAG: phytanoyl-CoA dioxygenase family protein [Alphaproteobacteria bacterium]|nr:MAG: phytanoyl-CoA dioxygenase family protein [Alphaproteobacteria bacterium]